VRRNPGHENMASKDHRQAIRDAARRRSKLQAQAEALRLEGSRELAQAVNEARGAVTMQEAAELAGISRQTLYAILRQQSSKNKRYT